MHARSLGAICAIALCFVALASATASTTDLKSEIAVRALQQAGPNTDITSGIIDGISVRFLFSLLNRMPSAAHGVAAAFMRLATRTPTDLFLFPEL